MNVHLMYMNVKCSPIVITPSDLIDVLVKKALEEMAFIVKVEEEN